MQPISIIGTGYVGLVTAACLADLGNDVTCIDIDAAKITSLQTGSVPFYEPGLQELVERNIQGGRLHFTTDYVEGLRNQSIIFIAVHTPSQNNGAADLTYVLQAARMIGEHITGSCIVVTKSTMPVGSAEKVLQTIRAHTTQHQSLVDIVANPEFLAQGSAVHDCMLPDRIVIGAQNRAAAQRLAELYFPLRAPIMLTDLRSAEMIKYASNAFLATKISYINEIAQICERLDVDIKEVAAGMGYDQRIGRRHLEAGVGFGGSCFGKDVKALTQMAHDAAYAPNLLHAVLDINAHQRIHMVDILEQVLGSLVDATIGVLGLAFKQNTDDMRDAPSIDIIRELARKGANIRCFDPVAMPKAQAVLTDVEIEYCQNAYNVAQGCDALLLVTHWNEFRLLDLQRLRNIMRQPVMIDGRNIYDPRVMRNAGIIYRGIGRANAVVDQDFSIAGPAIMAFAE